MKKEEHFKAIKKGVDLTEKWYCICGYLNNTTEIDIPEIKLKIGQLEWCDEGMRDIIAHKENKRVFFTRDNGNNIDFQFQIHDMYIHGNDYTLKFDKTIDEIHKKLLKYDEYNEYYGYIHTQFFNGKIDL